MLHRGVRLARCRTVQPARSVRLLRAVLDATNVLDLDRGAADIGHHQIVHLAWFRVASQRAQHQFTAARFDVAARHVCVLAHERLAYLCNWNVIRRQSFRIDPNVDGPIEIAHYVHLAHPTGALQLELNGVVGELSQLANRTIG